jgi:hypothetical protein
MNEGCLFWVFMGHGAPQTLQWAMFPDCRTPILQCEDCTRLRCRGAPPIALLMCCYTGAFAEPSDCLAEELLCSSGGPVAVLSGSNVTMPYGMAAMGREAFRQYFDEHRPTLGEWFLHTKRDTMAGYDLPIWSLASAAVGAVAPESVRPKEERLEHLQLFNLFGDPTLPLYRPRDVKLVVAKAAVAGEKILIEGECPIAGSATVELTSPLERLPWSRREKYDGSAKGRQRFDAEYHAVNDSRLAAATAEVREGRFSIELELPAAASGMYRVRAFVQGEGDCALGGSDISISAAKDHTAAAKGLPATTPTTPRQTVTHE